MFDYAIPAKSSTHRPSGLHAAILVVLIAAGIVAWLDYALDRVPVRRSMDEVFLAELKEAAGCDPTTLVPFEQLEIRVTKTNDDLLTMCERFVPTRKLRTKDLEPRK